MCEPEQELEETIEQANLRLLESGEFSDITFLIRPKYEKVRAHKLILASRSDVFDTKFEPTWDDLNKCYKNGIIEITDTDVKTFRCLLEFLYADKFDDAKEIVEIKRLIHLADKYNVEDLLSKCDDLLCSKFDLETCVAELYEVASFYDRDTVTYFIETVIARNFMKFSTTTEFLKIDEKFMLTLLMKNHLNIEEVNLFQTVIRWDESRLGNGRTKPRHSVLKKLLPQIRFPLMTLEQLALIVRPTKLIPAQDLLDIMAYKIAASQDEKEKLRQVLKYPVKPRYTGGFSVKNTTFTKMTPTQPTRRRGGRGS